MDDEGVMGRIEELVARSTGCSRRVTGASSGMPTTPA